MSNRPPMLSREELANLEVGVTDIRPGLARALTWFFLVIILTVPAIQIGFDLREKPGSWPHVASLLDWNRSEPLPGSGTWRRLTHANDSLLSHLEKWEDDQEDRSFLRKALLGPLQAAFLPLGVGNEKAYLGREGWLYYRPDVDAVVGRDFQAVASLRAITDFKSQLEARGVHLVLLPVPSKAAIITAPLGVPADQRGRPLHPAGYAAWLNALRACGVDVLDISALLAAPVATGEEYTFLRTDTHWTVAGMEAVAARLADHLRQGGKVTDGSAGLVRQTVHHRALGDIAQMLRLPKPEAHFPAEPVALHPVTRADGSPWTPETKAPILLLGDSFTNIFSLEAMGWGTGAGLAEQLSLALQQPVDTIVRNDAGSHATRDMLAQELAAGRDRLAGKKVVVWEFAARELAFGDWKEITLAFHPTAETGGAPANESEFLTAPATGTLTLRARVAQASPVPKPGTVAYADHVRALLLDQLRDDRGQHVPGRAVAYARSMTAHQWTAAAAWKPGDEVELSVSAWSAQEPKLGSINRSELADDDLLLVDPVWVEPTAVSAASPAPAARGRLPALLALVALFAVAGWRFHREDRLSRA